jgi:hypothetical protein
MTVLNSGVMTVQEGENLVALEFEIKQRNIADPETLEPLDLTDATVTMEVDDGEVLACIVTNPAAGLAMRLWEAGDTLPGTHDFRVVTTFLDGRIFRGQRLVLDVEPSVA